MTCSKPFVAARVFEKHFSALKVLSGIHRQNGSSIQNLPNQFRIYSTHSDSPKLKWSYAHGASEIPLMNVTTGRMLRDAVEDTPDREFFVFPKHNIRKTFSQFWKDAERLASGLLALGVKRGDRVGMWGPNTYEWVVTQFATALAGMIFVTINPAYRVNEFEYVMRKVGITAIVSASSFKTQDYYDMIVDACPEVPSSKLGSLHSERLPDLKHVIMFGDKHSGTWSFDEISKAGDSKTDSQLKQLLEDVQPDDAANIQFTSGTTGSPKGATLSHFNIVNNAYFIGRRMGAHLERTIIVCPPPLYHCYGCVGGSLASAVHRSTIIFPSPGFEPLACLQAVHNEKATSLFGTPTMYIDMLNHPDFNNYQYTSLSRGTMAGAPCPIEVCKKLVDKMHMKYFIIFYGSTETSPVSHSSLTSDSLEDRVSYVGTVLEHVEGKVVDHEGRVVRVGQQGELYTRGYMVMLGYWNDVEKTKEVIGPDRWYKSGDLATMNEEGRTKIVGRTKDMIVRGGENVYPTEVEQFLFTHPKIEDVQVFGVPDERMGEEVCAWIRLHHSDTATEQEIKDFCKGKLAHFKIPRYILFKKESQFPLTISGKAQKFKMRDISKKELGLDHVRPHFQQ